MCDWFEKWEHKTKGRGQLKDEMIDKVDELLLSFELLCDHTDQSLLKWISENVTATYDATGVHVSVED
jgi:hypothetical protein